MPGCSAMQRNHWPPSLTTVVPAAIPAHSRLVSPVWNPRTTWRRAGSGRPSPGARRADIGVVDLDPRPAGTKLVAAIALDHGLHQLVLDSPGGVGRDPQPPAQLDVGQAFLALGEQ